MRIANVPTPASSVDLTSAQQLADAPLSDNPEGRLLSTFGDALFSIVGVHSIGYNRVTAPGVVRISMDTFDQAKLADNTLRDTVFGVRLLFADPDGNPYDMSAPGAGWTSRPTNSARLVSAMPDVLSYMNLGNALVFVVESMRVRDTLRMLVEDRPNGLYAIWNVAHRPAVARIG